MTLNANRDIQKKPCSVRWSKAIGSVRSQTRSFTKSWELSAIGNRINQLAAKANALDYIDTPMLQEEAARWRQFQTDVRKAYLLPKRVSG